jgi:hypothetical protein
LKQRMTALSKQKVEKPQGAARKAVAWSSRGPIYADEMAEISRVNTTRAALREIADAQGDVDAYIAQYDSKTRKVPNIAAEIAERLLTAGRAKEALHFIDAAEVRQTDWIETEWEDARINVLDALGRGAEAQAARLSCFERALSASHLRAYLKRLADFDDLEAEEKALGTAERYQHFHHALSFLIGWPDLARAARMVIQRPAEMNGKHYDILTPAADALAEKYPLSATLLLRAMIDFALVQSRATRYGHAARHLMECTRLAAAIRDFAAFETHAAYVARLHREHPKKAAFWNLMPG